MTIRKAFTATATDLGPRSIRVICSTETVDLSGEVVEQAGIDLSGFKSNPICLWGHDPDHPIGLVTTIAIIDNQMTADIEFAPAGISHKADEVCGLVKAGIVKGISIGFDPIETAPMNPAKPKGPQRYIKCALLEVSVVSIPANPDAEVVQRARAMAEALLAPECPEGTEAIMTEKNTRARTRKARTSAPKIKALYDVGRLCYLLDELGWATQSARIESAIEGDASKVPGMLAEAMRSLGETLVAMAAEEVTEAIADAMATPVEDADTADLSDDDVVIIQQGATPAVQKFRIGKARARVQKEGRKISADTAACIKEAQDMHEEAMDMHRKAIGLSVKCMKSIGDLLPEAGSAQDGNDDPAPDDGAAQNDKKAAPVVMTKAARMARAIALAPLTEAA